MRIIIFQPMLKNYRTVFYEHLYNLLLANGHQLRVVFGSPWVAEKNRNDNVVVDKQYLLFEKSKWLLWDRINVQKNSLKHILWADIVITEQANKHLHNYLLILFRSLKFKPYAYWGHGLNRQGNPKSSSERLKRFLATKVDWWFAYTQSVGEYLEGVGFSTEAITVLNNSCDTTGFKQELINISAADKLWFKEKYGIAEDAEIGLFCGSLEKDKGVEFLLKSAVEIHKHNHRFVLLVGGGGRYRPLVEQYAQQYAFIIYLGRIDNQEKSLAFSCADVFLNPGMIGLAILDAFSAGLPVFTTRQAAHSPEIDYLQEHFNGLMSDYNLNDYTAMVLSVLESTALLDQLKNNARLSSNQFSIEQMAENFSLGIEKFLAKTNTH